MGYDGESTRRVCSGRLMGVGGGLVDRIIIFI